MLFFNFLYLMIFTLIFIPVTDTLKNILVKEEAEVDDEDEIEVLEQDFDDDQEGLNIAIKEDNRMVLIVPWKCPRTLSKKLSVIVALPSGIVPEMVKFSFLGRSKFESNRIKLTYNWPCGLISPRTLFKDEIKKDPYFTQMSEFIEFKEVVREMKRFNPNQESNIEIELPMVVQRSVNSYEYSIKSFKTGNSAVIGGRHNISGFSSLRNYAKVSKSIEHKVYFMYFRFTGSMVEEETDEQIQKKCVIDIDDIDDDDDSVDVDFKKESSRFSKYLMNGS